MNLREFREDREKDAWTMVCVRRVILDTLWSRASSTVHSNYLRACHMEDDTVQFGQEAMPLLPALGPHPLSDSFGMCTAIHMVARLVRPGRNTATLQFDTLRKYY